MNHRGGKTVLALLLVLIPSLSAATPTPREIKQSTYYYEAASRALKSGNLHKAKDYFWKAAQIFPDFPEAHLGLGHVAMGEQQFEIALGEYELARDGYSKVGDALYDLRLARYQDAQSEIVKLRDQIMSLQRNSSPYSTIPLNLTRQITELEESIQRLEAIKLPRPETAHETPGEVYFYLGNALFRLNRLDQAVGAWERCARKSRGFPLVFNNLAVAYWKEGRIREARESLATAEQMGFKVNPRFKQDLEQSASRFPAEAMEPPAAADGEALVSPQSAPSP